NGHDEDAVSVQQARGPFEGFFGRRRGVLEDFAGNEEIVHAGFALGWLRDVEARGTVEEGVAIVEFCGKGFGVGGRVADSETAKALHVGKVGERQAEAEEFERERVNQAARAEAGAATGATGALAVELLAPPIIIAATDVAGELGHRRRSSATRAIRASRQSQLRAVLPAPCVRI